MKKLTVIILPEILGVCRLESGVPFPDWLHESSNFFALIGTVDETSIVCREDLIPAGCPFEKEFRALKVKGPLGFSLTGVLASLLTPLAEAGISVFTLSTYETDYILVKQEHLEKAIRALRSIANII